MARWNVRFEEDRAFRRSHGSDTEVREQEAPTTEVTPTPTATGGQPSNKDEEEQQQQEAPSTSTRKKPRWFLQTLKDAQEHVGAPRSTFKESRPSRQ